MAPNDMIRHDHHEKRHRYSHFLDFYQPLGTSRDNGNSLRPTGP